MCGRFTLTRQDRRELAQLLGVDDDDLRDYRPRYNIAPTDQHFIVPSKHERRTARTASWGLVNSWATDNSRASQCINAKAETLQERRAFRESFPATLLGSNGRLLRVARSKDSARARLDTPYQWRTFVVRRTLRGVAGEVWRLAMDLHDHYDRGECTA